MLENSGNELKTLTMDHHGLIAAVCKDLKIADRIDKRLGVDSQRIVSPGQSVVAMIINGLGFTNRRLYLTNQFFETKPVERLLDADIKAESLTDHTLGKTLDEIWKYGATQLFGEVAFETAIENNLLGVTNHLDTTSISVVGEYAFDEVAPETTKKESKAPKVLEIRHGYSKDKRPDLKQLVLSLVVNGPSAMPIWMETLNGNSSDKASFHETIEKVKAFQKAINVEDKCKWIADSALYSENKLLKSNDYLWLTRVPETIKEAREPVEKMENEIEWKEQENGYKTAKFESNHGGVKQRWLLVFSEQAYMREKKTLEKNLKTKDVALKKALWHVSNELFECEEDAKKFLKQLVKKQRLHKINSCIFPVLKYAKSGKPKVGEEKIIVGYKIESTFERDADALETLLRKKGRFILATNDLCRDSFSEEQMLREYKAQQKVEGGFRFLKDPWFMADSVFLKSAKRIEALMMVMTLCLMVYNIAQYKLREKLKETNDTLPNQLKKEVKNPTLRWIFQIMEGISIVRLDQNNSTHPWREIISNLSVLRRKIIKLFGETAAFMYGLIQKNTLEGVGM
jgi:transposase